MSTLRHIDNEEEKGEVEKGVEEKGERGVMLSSLLPASYYYYL